MGGGHNISFLRGGSHFRSRVPDGCLTCADQLHTKRMAAKHGVEKGLLIVEAGRQVPPDSRAICRYFRRVARVPPRVLQPPLGASSA